MLKMNIPELIKISEDLSLLRIRFSEAIEVFRNVWSNDEKIRESLEL